MAELATTASEGVLSLNEVSNLARVRSAASSATPAMKHPIPVVQVRDVMLIKQPVTSSPVAHHPLPPGASGTAAEQVIGAAAPSEAPDPESSATFDQPADVEVDDSTGIDGGRNPLHPLPADLSNIDVEESPLVPSEQLMRDRMDVDENHAADDSEAKKLVSILTTKEVDPDEWRNAVGNSIAWLMSSMIQLRAENRAIVSSPSELFPPFFYIYILLMKRKLKV